MTGAAFLPGGGFGDGFSVKFSRMVILAGGGEETLEGLWPSWAAQSLTFNGDENPGVGLLASIYGGRCSARTMAEPPSEDTKMGSYESAHVIMITPRATERDGKVGNS